MSKKKAKLIYKHNSFDVIEEGDYVLCAVSRKEIMLKDLNYWNVELQEAYFSPIEVNERYKTIYLMFSCGLYTEVSAHIGFAGPFSICISIFCRREATHRSVFR